MIQQDMGKSSSLGPVRRKRTVLELEVHGGHMEGPRWVKQQKNRLAGARGDQHPTGCESGRGDPGERG